ncbi:non-ribosomal peptide synthase/polyketide synthase, partial [Danxiaibacter flavus]
MTNANFPLHPSQQDVYWDQIINTRSTHYNIGGCLKLKGLLDKGNLLKAITSAPAVFDTFKMRFQLNDLDSVCYFDDSFDSLEVPEIDFSGYSNPEERARAWVQEQFNTPFSIQKENFLFEHALLRIEDNEHWLFHRYHHFITDGFGFAVWLQYLAQKYTSLRTGNDFIVEYPGYRDVIINEKKYADSSVYAADKKYWTERIQEKPQQLLKTKYKSLPGSEKHSSTYLVRLNEARQNTLQEIKRETGYGLQQLTIAALLIYFGKTSDKTSFVFGSSVHKRNSKHLRNIMGMFSGLLPYHATFQPGMTLIDLLKEISIQQKKDYRHQNFLVSDIIRHFKINFTHEYLCEVVINYEQLDFSLDFGSDVQATIEKYSSFHERYPLDICWQDYGKQQPLSLRFNFRNEYFLQSEIELLAQRLLFIFEQMPLSLNKSIGSIDIIPATEKQQLLVAFNATKKDYPADKTLIDLFQQQVSKTPAATAVVFQDEVLTFEQLNDRANQLAHYLLKKQVKKETLVAICLERSFELIISVLGILKAGPAYVPVDPAYPKERIDYILSDTQAPIILTSSSCESKLPANSSATIVQLDREWRGILKEPSINPESNSRPENLAYVIYTSGSTGVPKGVMIEHKSVVNLITAQSACFGITEDERILLFSNYCFDASVEQMFLALLNGVPLVLFPEGLQLEPASFGLFLQSNHITHLHATPAFIENVPLVAYECLKRVIAGGDICKTDLADKWKNKVRFYNEYGPTETTVTSIEFLDDGERMNNSHLLSLGRPLANTEVYVLDNDQRLVPIGTPGEICISGAGLARGYLNRPELTAEKFIRHPFHQDKKLYRTGDIGCWNTNGCIEFLGRQDEQLKIRGYRIEPGEIEAVLQQSGLVQECVIVGKDDTEGYKQLVGYVVVKGELDSACLVAYLEHKLPRYMIPHLWVKLDRLPLTSTGKINRKALPDIEPAQMLSNVYVAPRNYMEKKLAEIWQELLCIDNIGVYDNFFELGGHSLIAFRMASAIRKELAIEAAIKELFAKPTIDLFAKYLQQQKNDLRLLQIEPQERPDCVPLSFAQERLWFIHRLQGSTQYHMPAVLRLQGKLDVKALGYALESIVNRHEILKTVIVEKEGKPYQYISEQQWRLDIVGDFPGNGDNDELNRFIDSFISRPFDLETEHMLRACLIAMTGEFHILVLVLHHIAADGWSVSVLVREVMEFYEASIEDRPVQLSALHIQYADYAVWQRKHMKEGMPDEGVSYWKEKLQGVKMLDLPTDYIRPAVQNTQGALVHYTLSNELTISLKKIASQNSSTLYITLLAAFKILLYRYSGQTDICIGTAIAGRKQQELETLIGFFVNTLALRDVVDANTSFVDFLQQVKHTVLDAFKHQDIPFEKVVDAVVEERELSKSPLVQILFTLQNTPVIPELHLGEVQVSIEDRQRTTAQFDINFTIIETIDGIRWSVEYRTDLFKEPTICSMLVHYEQLLNAIVQDTGKAIGDLRIITKDEEHQLLHEFNNAAVDYPKDKTIIDLFALQVRRKPAGIALICGEGQLNYEMLNQRANQLAGYLQQKGVELRSNVGLLATRGIEMIVGILGILKTGAAYVPLNIDYPGERLKYIIQDAGLRHIVCTDCEMAYSKGLGFCDCIDINDSLAFPGYEVNHTTDSCAYIMYTSGTTGHPKGIAISHKNVVKLVSDSGCIAVEENDRMLQWSNYSFDGSVYEIFGSLLQGATLCLVKDAFASDVYELANLIKTEQITICFITTALFNKFIDIDPLVFCSLRKVLFGGEMVSCSHVSRALSAMGPDKLVHVYGPTECTVFTTCYPINMLNGENTVPIGRPLSNTNIYITDERLALVPPGMCGEICIAGDGLAMGYLNQAGMSAEKFIQNRFGNGRLYRSGDLGRWDADGNIEFLGRVDDQVKIRGYRIEPGEVEAVVLQTEWVSQCTVIAKEDNNGHKRLVGYVVAKASFNVEQLTAFLKERLPGYMIPSLWIEIETMPLTSHGKIDKKALPDAPAPQSFTGVFVAPHTETEQVLAAIWQKVLGVEQVGIHDNFFELGGDSILAVSLVSQINQCWDKAVGIQDVFELQTVASLARHITQTPGKLQYGWDEAKREVEGIEDTILGDSNLSVFLPDDWQCIYPMSDIEKGMLYYTFFNEGAGIYHEQVFSHVSGITLDTELFKKAFLLLVEKHESLRSSFHFNTFNTPVQIVHNTAQENISYRDLSHLDLEAQKEFLELFLEEDRQTSFEITKPGLWRITIFELSEKEYTICWSLLHAIIDGWSAASLLNELSHVYFKLKENCSYKPEPLRATLKDYITDQFRYKKDLTVKDFWVRYLDGYSRTDLPFAKGVNVLGQKHFQTATFIVDGELGKGLEKLSNKLQIHVKDVYLAAFMYLLKITNYSDDILAGLVTHGRPEVVDGEMIIGCFLNTVPFRYQFQQDETPEMLLLSINKKARELKAYDRLSLFEIMETTVGKTAYENPFFDVIFNYIDFYVLDEMRKEFSIREPLVDMSTMTNTSLDLTIQKVNGGHQVIFNFLDQVFERTDVDRLTVYYRKILDSFIKHASSPLRIDAILAPSETHMLLNVFNDTKRDYSFGKTLVDLLEEQVLLTPENTAVKFENQKLTYSQLNERANQVAYYLAEKGVKKETLVLVLVERSLEMVIGMLAILKAGGAYVPIDPDYPAERVRFILKDTNATIMLGHIHYKDLLEDYTLEIVDLKNEEHFISKKPCTNPANSIDPSQLVYVVYTSGSTGKPKGVMIENRSVVNYLSAFREYFSIAGEDKILQQFSVSFDMMVEQVFLALISGACLIVLKDGRDLNSLKEKIESNDATILSATPSMINWLNKELLTTGNLRYLISGGDTLYASHIDNLFDKITIVNGYGPSETTVAVSFHNIKELSGASLIGKPVPNTSVYILDKNQQLLPSGAIGEICVGGVQVARGYLNLAKETRTKFIEDPFSNDDKRKLFRTGDIGRWLHDGTLEFLGRLDEQVQVRGYRVEPAEIEIVLQQNELVSNAVVVTREDEPGDLRLAAYIVLKATGPSLLWPSVGEYPIYDDLLYYALTHDETRNDEYRYAFSQLVKDKSVLDIGTGKDAILARLCIEAGAKIVYAVESDFEAFEHAKQTVCNLHLEDNIVVILGDVLNATIGELVDVCVSEIIGTIGGSEGANVILNNARRFLKEDGRMIPQRCLTRMAAITFPDNLYDHPVFDKAAGFYADKIFDQLGAGTAIRLCIKNLPHANIISTDAIVEDLNFNSPNDEEYENEFVIEITKNARFDGLLFWINLFPLEDRLINSLNGDTNWLPVYFPLFYPGIEVQKGDYVQGKFVVRLSANNVNPDYSVQGTLIQKKGTSTDFGYNSFYQPACPTKNAFYLKLFQSINKATEPESGSDLVEMLRRHLGKRLPAYMVPDYFHFLETLPLTKNGKIDKKALPVPDRHFNKRYLAPETLTQEKLINIWQQLLEVERIGIGDDFFALGGNSLTAVRVIALVRSELQTEIAIRDLFAFPTIESLSKHLQSQNRTLLLPSIQVQDRPHLLPLSFAQERLWFIDKLQGSIQYHMQAVLRVNGNIDAIALENALQSVIARHEILRTVICEDNGQPWQLVRNNEEWRLQIIANPLYKESPDSLKQCIRQIVDEPFDLSADYMIRASLIPLEQEESIIVLVIHHIASDGWSLSVLMKEVAGLYSAYLMKRKPDLSCLPIQYSDYALWQRQYLEGEILHRQLEYWKKKLSDAPVLQLRTDYPRPPVHTARGKMLHCTINKILCDQLEAFSLKEGVTLFMTLLATFKVLMYRYTGQADISIGTPVAGRRQLELENMIGLFVNTIVVRSEVNDQMTFALLLRQLKQTILEAFEYQDAPFEKVVEAVVEDRDLSRNPLVQILFVLQNTPEIPQFQLGDTRLSIEEHAHGTTPFDISVSIEKNTDGLQCYVQYCTDLYASGTIESMFSHYEQLLKAITQNSYQTIASLQMLTGDEERQLLYDFNNTAIQCPVNLTVVDMFEQQVLKDPDAIAVVFGEYKLTYKQLNERSNQLAHYLRKKGVREEVLVPICIERSPEMIIGLIGILKAGGAYVPFDPEYPQERINYMLSDISASVVITSERSKEKLLSTANLDIIELDQNDAVAEQPAGNPSKITDSTNLTFVLYTSGSTGRPKGVLMPCSNLVNLLLWQEQQFSNKYRHVLQFASLNFDVSFQEIFSTLCFGGSLYLIDNDLRRDTPGLVKFIKAYGITHLFMPYGALKNLAEQVCLFHENSLPIEEVIVAGEQLKLTEDICQLVNKDRIKLVNQYGPTEAHVVTSYAIDVDHPSSSSLPPIGKPIYNTSIYMLRNARELLPIGVAGEICIAGECVARGYLNNNKLTAEKFVENPFGGGRLYRTGDLGRWLEDGNIEYLGRIDDQVKIRGYRVEPGEIESVILQSNLASQCVVLAKENGQGFQQLLCYVVPKTPFDKTKVVEYLKSKLPDYMIPANWIILEKLPVTANGKINKKALPDPDGDSLFHNRYEAPETDLQQVLANLWQELLGVDKIGILDNFFSLGGHSLIAVRVIAGIRRLLQVEVAIKDLFIHPTIKELAECIQVQNKEQLIPVIKKTQHTGNIPLSFSQERIWFIDQLQGSVQYHLPAVLRLKGKINVPALNHALQCIVNRHEVLRTVFLDDGGIPYQHVLQQNSWHLDIADEHLCLEHNQNVQDYINGLISQPFDLATEHMLRAHLIALNENEHILVVILHHIASDGWSLSVLVKEITELYDAYEQKRRPQLSELPVQYADYALWQRDYLQGDLLDKRLQYWKDRLQGVGMLALRCDFPRPAMQSTRGAAVEHIIDHQLTEQLKQVALEHDCTLFMVMLAAFKVLLFRYSGQTDICVGTPVAGRRQQELEGLIGFFVNMLPLRTEINAGMTCIELLQQVRQTTIEAYEHQDAPFEKIVDALVNERDITRAPLVQVLFVLQNTPTVPQLHLGDLQLSWEPSAHQTTLFDLTVGVIETGGELHISTEYCTDLFRENTIRQLLMHYEQLLRAMTNYDDRPIYQLPLLTKQEEHQLLYDFNNTEVAYPEDKTIIDLFEEQVKKTPGNIAVMYEEEVLTYQQLNERSNQLAWYLRSRGVKEETLVPVCIERGLAMIIGILGILKAGGAYVPIDPEYPQERIKYMLQDTAATIVVSSRKSWNSLKDSEEIRIIELEQEASDIAQQPVINLNNGPEATNLAYVIYTSGSTGKPKGVMIEHRNVVRLFFNQLPLYDFDENDVWSMFHSFCFDFSVWEMFGALLFGGRLVIVPSLISKDAIRFAELLIKEKVTILNQTPSAFYVLQDYLVHKPTEVALRYIIFGGEALNPTRLQPSRELSRNCRFINMYGITETTVHVTFQLVETAHILAGSNSIGRPIPTLSIYILDELRQLVPIGVAGEICVAGAGLARGYLNRRQLTEEKFVQHPYGAGRIYLSGDQGRWLPDGTIEYCGRRDDQVKIRGYRIEPGEIESALLQSELVSQCVVIANEDIQGHKKLTGYVVAKGIFNRESIMAYLQSRLPSYMVPSLLIELDSLPLTSNGKVDKKALPVADGTLQLSGQYVAPRNEAEEQLAAIWQELLGIEKISIHDNFFELGGHSLTATRVVAFVRERMQVEIAIKDLFLHPTIENLAASLYSRKQALLLPVIRHDIRPDHIPLSFAQERLWFIHLLQGSIQYHMPVVLRLKGKLNEGALNYALKEIIHRHEILRTIIKEEEGKAYQFIQQEECWQLNKTDNFKYGKDVQELNHYIEKLVSKPFDLDKDYMLRADLITLEDDECLLVIVMHHIASDGWSLSVLAKEIEQLYAFSEGKATERPALPIQYADYAIWQRKYLDGEMLNLQLRYWKNKLNGVATLQLPANFSRPVDYSPRGNALYFSWDKLFVEQLKEFSLEHYVTLFMTLLAAFKLLLYRYTGQPDICVGTPIAGRRQLDLEQLIGFFVNTLALRDHVSGEMSFIDLLQQVKQTTLEAYEHQDAPFEKVVEAVVVERDLGRNPLVQVLFVLQNVPEVPGLQLEEATLINEEFDLPTAKFDLTFTVMEIPEGIKGSVEFSTDLYNAETISGMLRHFEQLLHAVIEAPGKKIALQTLLSPSEEEQLLNVFNDPSVQLKDETFVTLFEQQAQNTPDNISVIYKLEQLTYKELNERSNQLAHCLRNKGVKSEMPVPVCLENSPGLIIAIIGIFKAGGSYVPVDPELPSERLNYIIKDTSASIIICNAATKTKLGEIVSNLIVLDQEWSLNGCDYPIDNPPIDVHGKHLAYIMYTSGSTGKPKGVMVNHNSLINYLQNSKTTYISSDSDYAGSFVHLSSTFDASLTAILMPLLHGRLSVISSQSSVNVFNDSNLLKYAPYDFIKITPAHLVFLNEFFKHANRQLLTKKLVIGGEALHLNQLRDLKNSNIDIEIVNEYGPTEATVGCSTYTLQLSQINEKQGGAIPIGKPIDNTQIYILDTYCQLVPVGVFGELYIAGAGLARGYLNNEALTSEKFILNPFGEGYLYRTGDWGRYLVNGDIEYLGRTDQQVKVSGYRIELGEIENVLLEYQPVKQCVMLTKEDDVHKQLIGYYVTDRNVTSMKEHTLYENHINNWKEVYKLEYGKITDDKINDPEFNTIGWMDSFTGRSIPADQMKEWLRDIMDVIFEQRPQNVLEIGCGTGMIYYQLAGKIKKYIGTDFSAACIDEIRQRISEQQKEYGVTKLFVCAAHEVSLKEERVDTVILNSVIQYFPGEDYLTEIIEKCIDHLQGKGCIVIGDIRDNHLQKLFNVRLQIQKLQKSVRVRDLIWSAKQRMLDEQELCLSPGYFHKLQSLYPVITHIDLLAKQAFCDNELTAYRYTAVICVDIEKSEFEPQWQEWGSLDNSDIINQIDKGLPVLAFANVPNPRLKYEMRLQQALYDTSLNTIQELENNVDLKTGDKVDPDQVLKHAKAKGYSYKLFKAEDPLYLNIFLHTGSFNGYVRQPYLNTLYTSDSITSNMPLHRSISAIIQKDIRAYLQSRLPSYMVPSLLIELDSLPLTPNGKVDKKALPVADGTLQLIGQYVAP